MRVLLIVLVAISTYELVQCQNSTSETPPTSTEKSQPATPTQSTTTQFESLPKFPEFDYDCFENGTIYLNGTEIGLENGTSLDYEDEKGFCRGTVVGKNDWKKNIIFSDCGVNEVLTVTLHHSHSTAQVTENVHKIACTPNSYHVFAKVLERNEMEPPPTVETKQYNVSDKIRNHYEMTIENFRYPDKPIHIGNHLNITILAPHKKDKFTPVQCYAEPEPQTYPDITAKYVFWDPYSNRRSCTGTIDHSVITTNWKNHTKLTKSAEILAFRFPREDGVKITCEIKVCPATLAGTPPESCTVTCPNKKRKGSRTSRRKVSAVFRVTGTNEDVSDSSNGSDTIRHRAVLFVVFSATFVFRIMI